MYWVFSDFFKRPNLTANAISSVTDLKKNIKKLVTLQSNLTDYIVLFYGFSIIFFWGLIVYRFAFFGTRLIQKIPNSFFSIIRMAKHNTFEFDIFFNSIYNLFFFTFTLLLIYALTKRIIMILIQTFR